MIIAPTLLMLQEEKVIKKPMICIIVTKQQQEFTECISITEMHNIPSNAQNTHSWYAGIHCSELAHFGIIINMPKYIHPSLYYMVMPSKIITCKFTPYSINKSKDKSTHIYHA